MDVKLVNSLILLVDSIEEIDYELIITKSFGCAANVVQPGTLVHTYTYTYSPILKVMKDNRNIFKELALLAVKML